jgi:hypothetical protein
MKEVKGEQFPWKMIVRLFEVLVIGYALIWVALVIADTIDKGSLVVDFEEGILGYRFWRVVLMFVIVLFFSCRGRDP